MQRDERKETLDELKTTAQTGMDLEECCFNEENRSEKPYPKTSNGDIKVEQHQP